MCLGKFHRESMERHYSIGMLVDEMDLGIKKIFTKNEECLFTIIENEKNQENYHPSLFK